MKKIKIFSFFIFILFLVVSNGLAFFSFPGYSIFHNTTSHLGAQGSPHAWIMNLVFIALGIMAVLVTFHTRIIYHQVVGAAFGLSLLLTGIFQHAPLIESLTANQLQDQVHSFFASATGFSFSLLAFGHAFMSTGSQRAAGFVLALSAIIIPIAMMSFPAFMGLLQRIMFAGAFGWLFFYLESPKNKRL